MPPPGKRLTFEASRFAPRHSFGYFWFQPMKSRFLLAFTVGQLVLLAETKGIPLPKRTSASCASRPMRAQRCDFDVATACFLHLPHLRFCAQPLRRLGGHIRLGQPTAHQRAVLLVRRRESRGRGAWVDRA